MSKKFRDRATWNYKKIVKQKLKNQRREQKMKTREENASKECKFIPLFCSNVVSHCVFLTVAVSISFCQINQFVDFSKIYAHDKDIKTEHLNYKICHNRFLSVLNKFTNW